MTQTLALHDWSIILEPSGGCEFMPYYSFDTQGLIIVDHEDDLVLMAELTHTGQLSVKRIAPDKIIDFGERTLTVRCNPLYHE